MSDRTIGGPARFVLTAENDQRFAEAVHRKRLLDIAGTRPTGDILAARPAE